MTPKKTPTPTRQAQRSEVMSWKIESASLAAKVGSLIVHVEEASSTDAHHFDSVAIAALLMDPEIVEWLRELRSCAMVPVKRVPKGAKR